MVVRYHAVCILLLAILHVVFGGQEVLQELMKQRQESHKNTPPSVKNMIKMKRKNGFLSRKRKRIVAKQKNSIKTAKESGIGIKQANVRVPRGEKLALAHKKSGWCFIHNGKNKLKYKRKCSKEACKRACDAGKDHFRRCVYSQVNENKIRRVKVLRERPQRGLCVIIGRTNRVKYRARTSKVACSKSCKRGKDFLRKNPRNGKSKKKSQRRCHWRSVWCIER